MTGSHVPDFLLKVFLEHFSVSAVIILTTPFKPNKRDIFAKL
jgi:hypothetical protein